MDDLKVTIIQTNLFWEDADQNLNRFDQILAKLDEPADLILLPETFNTGFSINPARCAETMEERSVRFLKAKAMETNTVIMATLIISESCGCYNRLLCVYPDGRMTTYDKRHLFRLSEEYLLFNKGHQQLITEVKGWKISPIICYDLRFPVWSKNTWKDGNYGYDLMVCLANWPASRSHIWKVLLQARAMENQACVAGVNRIGADGNGTWHSGDSMAVDARGNVIFAAAAGQEEVKTVTFSASELQSYRESITVGKDWDQFTLNP